MPVEAHECAPTPSALFVAGVRAAAAAAIASHMDPTTGCAAAAAFLKMPGAMPAGGSAPNAVSSISSPKDPSAGPASNDVMPRIAGHIVNARFTVPGSPFPYSQALRTRSRSHYKVRRQSTLGLLALRLILSD